MDNVHFRLQLQAEDNKSMTVAITTTKHYTVEYERIIQCQYRDNNKLSKILN